MTSDPNIFLDEGELIELGSNSPISLDAQSSVWFIVEGNIDLFGLPLRDGNPVGARTHFLRIEPGQIFFGLRVSPTSVGVHFIGVPGNNTRIHRLSRERLKQVAQTPQHSSRVTKWLAQWITALYRAMGTSLVPKEHTDLEAGGQIEAGDGTNIRITDEVSWIEHISGRSWIAGINSLELDPASGLVPISSRSWLRVVEQSVVQNTATASLLQSDRIWDALDGFGGLISHWALKNIAEAEQRESARLDAKALSQSVAVRGAVGQLSALLVPEKRLAWKSEPEVDPLFAACALIAERFGLKPSEKSRSRQNTLDRDSPERIAKEFRLRIRRVILSGNWWKQDAGPLLAYLDGTRAPVALLPASATRYEIVDTAQGTRVLVDSQTVHRLSPAAFSFYRPFPDRALSVIEVCKFGLQDVQADLKMVLMMGVCGGVISMIMPIFTGIIFDSVIPSAARSQLGYFALALVVGCFASVIFNVTRGIAMLRLEAKSDASIQGAVWDRLLRLPLPFFRNYTAGDLAMRADGINAIREILSGAVLSSVLSGVFSIFSFGLLFYYSVPLAFIAMGLVGFNIIVGLAISFYSLRYQRPIYALQGKISGQVLQLIMGISKLRVAGAEPHAYSEWAKAFGSQKELDLKIGRVVNLMHVFNELYPIFSTMILYEVMVFWAIPNLTTGRFLAFSAAFSTFLYAMLDLCSAFMSIQYTVPVYERAKPILDTLPEISESKQSPGDLTGQIEFSHVSFRYAKDGPLILRDVSFQIAAGEFVAIVGPSGSGKSTLFRLLLGFESPESGTIYYDGMDLAVLDIQLVRKRLGVVLQNGKLAPGDIFQNIVGFSPRTLDDAWDAACKAGLDEDIDQMPMGMHTVLSEGAGTLSGGQRQRLMIARAIVGKPRILLFDEATSALDNRTQAIVSRSLEQLQATRIVIAHRLSTIVNADRIIVLKAGQIVQVGNYAKLLPEDGPFAELTQRQLA
ncbi:MAG: NHLP bacteriocin export ABC transporter permease/ATPase subunit [Pedosphaera sp.]|nr:NHLP bacteriocin export ABC transporter permease/ATPase subunit [Pedosphaera sp.]